MEDVDNAAIGCLKPKQARCRHLPRRLNKTLSCYFFRMGRDISTLLGTETFLLSLDSIKRDLEV